VTRLPPLLQPWSAWLALLPADLAAPLGDLLLRLHPVLGPLRRHAASRPAEPAGVGDIVRRGSYERLLLSEWAYADSAPDEFLRRAANGELLFTGPEPAHSEEPLRSIALFDAGPAQLGEPRLAHIALFILLARRAELAGAKFRWGILQHPGTLHDEQGKEGVLHLLGARSYAVANAATLEAWQAILDDAPHDAWLVGAPDTPCPPAVRARVQVRRSLLADQLDVVLSQHRSDRAVTLPLPPPQTGVRLLRNPFETVSKAHVTQAAEGTHSLKRAPLFGNRGDRVAVGMVDGDVFIYHIPDSVFAQPGKPRQAGKRQCADNVIAAGLFRKSYCTIHMRDGALHFSGFPGPYFDNAPNLPVPPSDEFHIVPGRRHHDPVFHLLHRTGASISERVLVLDRKDRLVCWTRTGATTARQPNRTTFNVFANNVIGAVPVPHGLLFAVSLGDRTDAYLLHASAATASHLYPIMHHGDRLLFGELKTWRGGGSVYALHLAGGDWLVGDRNGAEHVMVPDGASVLGCARPAPKEPPGLVVLAPNRLGIELLAAKRRSTLASATEPIAQASFDATHNRLAWLGQKSGALTVRAIGAEKPLLQTVPRRGPDAG
jgi:hypothetical protein